jgi:hypothetical protein
MKKGEGGNRREMQCGTQGSVSMARCCRSSARRRRKVGGDDVPYFGAGGGRRGQMAKRPRKPVGQFGRLGRRLGKKSFQNKNKIFKFTKALKNLYKEI